jgi:hypothetical protein
MFFRFVEWLFNRCATSFPGCGPVNQRDVAQAVELVRALRDQLHQMTRQLVRLERLDVSGTGSRASAIRCDTAALRRDIDEAQTLIDLLQLRYFNGNGLAQPRLQNKPGVQ